MKNIPTNQTFILGILLTGTIFMSQPLCAQSQEEIRQDSLQEDNKPEKGPDVSWSAFVDAFYAFDFNRPVENFRHDFFYNHNRHNEFNINLALLQLTVSHERYRANLGLQAGTYAMDNYALEDDLLKHVNEANIGISLNKSSTIWLDMGVFGSHLGFESAISADNPTLTRSLVAENSPYFLSGAKLTWNITDALLVSGTWSNGWQHIKRIEGNSFPGLGTQVMYTSEIFTANWSTFVCSEFEDVDRRLRYFNNFYAIITPVEKFKIIGGIDIGIQETAPNSTSYEIWAAPTIIGSYTFSEKWKGALRAEYYGDKASVIVETESNNGFRTSGLSFNLDYIPYPLVMARVEMRYLKSRDNIYRLTYFPAGVTTFIDENLFIVGSLSIRIKG